RPVEHQKGPHRRCFKMSSIHRLAVESTGAVRSRYRTGFLAISRTGGHPQARATLGSRGYKAIDSDVQYQIYTNRIFFKPVTEGPEEALAGSLPGLRRRCRPIFLHSILSNGS